MAMKFAIPVVSLLFGLFVGIFFMLLKMEDEVGRHKQYIFTLEHALKDKGVELSKEAMLFTINNMYPENEVVVEENAIYIHRMEFYFKDHKYSHGDIGVLRKR